MQLLSFWGSTSEWAEAVKMPHVSSADVPSDLVVQVDVQTLRLYCDPHQSERETACEIFSVVRQCPGFSSPFLWSC